MPFHGREDPFNFYEVICHDFEPLATLTASGRTRNSLSISLVYVFASMGETPLLLHDETVFKILLPFPDTALCKKNAACF